MLLFAILFSNNVHAEESTVKEIPGKSITLESLEEMFQNINQDTDWDTTQNMLWGFFFTHSELSKLELAKEKLESQGYNFVRFFLGDKEHQSEADTFWLHVEKRNPTMLNLLMLEMTNFISLRMKWA